MRMVINFDLIVMETTHGVLKMFFEEIPIGWCLLLFIVDLKT